jgi:hypothetical protein
VKSVNDRRQIREKADYEVFIILSRRQDEFSNGGGCFSVIGGRKFFICIRRRRIISVKAADKTNYLFLSWRQDKEFIV